MIKIFMLNSGKMIIGKYNSDTDILSDILEFFTLPMTSHSGQVFLSSKMLPLGSPINYTIIDLPLSKFSIQNEITDYAENIVPDYEKRVEQLKHPDLIIPNKEVKI